ncbi:hypothetical protein HK405_000039, partial [Cladochytrium tenue]
LLRRLGLLQCVRILIICPPRGRSVQKAAMTLVMERPRATRRLQRRMRRNSTPRRLADL